MSATETVHASPTAGAAVTSCCGRTPFELPRTDRMTIQRRLVTCRREIGEGASLIATERRRQVEQEGWTPEHDATHRDGRLALAAVCYALPDGLRQQFTGVPLLWPWASRFWKPRPDDRVRELVKAGALIAAEIDRLRAEL